MIKTENKIIEVAKDMDIIIGSQRALMETSYKRGEFHLYEIHLNVLKYMERFGDILNDIANCVVEDRTMAAEKDIVILDSIGKVAKLIGEMEGVL